MSNTGPVKVKLIGFTASTRTLLKSTFAGYTRKGRAFTEAAGDEKPSLYLLDSDDLVACETWRDEHAAAIDAPVVAIGKAPFDLQIPVMPKPLQWGLLHETLLSALETPPPRWPESHRAHLSAVARNKPAMSAGDLSSGLRKKLLVVDDSATVRHYMSIKLLPYGFTVEYAESGEEAIEKCKSTSYEVVFLDVVMPGLDGYDTCKKIRPLLSSGTPIVMVTTRDSPFDKMRGTIAGCTAYLVKPVDENTIAEIMARVIKTPNRK